MMRNNKSVETNPIQGSMELNDILDQKEERARNAVRAWRQGADDAESVAIVETDVPALVKALRFLWEEFSDVHAAHPALLQAGADHIASILKGNTP